MVVPINVAVVPYGVLPIEKPDVVNDLTRVTAALQIQVTRDFAPIWGVSATVTPFLSLDHVPVGYMALVLAAKVRLETLGVHYAAGGRPFAIVRYDNLKHPGNWSLAASHELLEMLTDPWGNRVIAARILGTEDDAGIGQVEYLLEVCDPCQAITYLIDGVLVSDFVTPDYYSPYATAGLRYSFTGKITEPRTVAEDGYITWRIPGSEELFQQHGPLTPDNEPKRLGGFSLLSAFSLRESVDSTLSRRGSEGSSDTPAVALYDEEFPNEKTLAEARDAYTASTVAAQKFGGALRRDIGNLLPMDSGVTTSSGPLTRVDIFEALGEKDFHAEYLENPRGAIENLLTRKNRKLDEDIVIKRDIPEKVHEDTLAPPEVFAWHAKQLRKQRDDRDLGELVFLPGGPLWWLAALGGG